MKFLFFRLAFYLTSAFDVQGTRRGGDPHFSTGKEPEVFVRKSPLSGPAAVGHMEYTF